MPQVEKNNLLCDRFLEGLIKIHSEPRQDIYVSDLVYCMRSAYFNKVNPKPPTETELNYFVDGANRHLCLQSISGLKREKKVEKHGVIGSIDLYGENGYPIEIKSTRSKYGIAPHYLKQLGFYCALCGVDEGHLIIQRILSKDKERPFEWYVVKYSPEEIEGLNWQLKDEAFKLRLALAKNDPSSLPKTEFFWKCQGCKHSEECMEASK